MGQTKGKPQVIYENYKPKNTHEMREYMLYVINRSLSKALQNGTIKRDSKTHQVLGKINSFKNLSLNLQLYIETKKS
jgi:hypothetical protein